MKIKNFGKTLNEKQIQPRKNLNIEKSLMENLIRRERLNAVKDALFVIAQRLKTQIMKHAQKHIPSRQDKYNEPEMTIFDFCLHLLPLLRALY